MAKKTPTMSKTRLETIALIMSIVASAFIIHEKVVDRQKR
jgi:hypothetical protein